MSKIKFITILSILLPASLMGQEVIIPVNGYPEAKEYYSKARRDFRKALSYDTLELPFIDDFSDSFVEPDPVHWSDKDAYINNKYTLSQITAGVATLDAYTYEGAHYENAGKDPYIADHLTSQPINLDYSISDNVYLSFYYQAKGLGEMPDENDSLCLEFLEPLSQEWNRIWSVPGDTLMDEFAFQAIKIDEEKYLSEGFRFRFLNYASQPSNTDFPGKLSNVDHWHIDYVELGAGRSTNDTVHRDVSFTKPLGSFLKDYTSMPWNHFEAAYFTQRKATIEVEITNLDTAMRNVTKALTITDLYKNFTYSPTPTANDIMPRETFDFNYEYDYPFEFNSEDSARFSIRATLRTDAFDYKSNDTLEFVQVFKNYYARDDGSAEAGYGLRGQGSRNTSAAVSFFSYTPDSLRAVDMYFNQVIDSVNLDYFFYLNVWDDNNGEPGNLIYSQVGERPRYSSLNELVRYELDSVIAVDGPFYVGWTKTVDNFINIGFDLNNDNSESNFYNLGDTEGWRNSEFPGSIMLRPVVSKHPLLSKVSDIEMEKKEILIYPNPADNYIMVNNSNINGSVAEIMIFDLGGRIIYHDHIRPNERINTERLENGIYLLRIIVSSGEHAQSKKIIIQH